MNIFIEQFYNLIKRKISNLNNKINMLKKQPDFYKWYEYLSLVNHNFLNFNIKKILKITELTNFNLDMIKISVCGTNGKSSICTILESILLESGYKVGLYLSPHINMFNERIKINGLNVDNNELIYHFYKIKKNNQFSELTYFELSTLTALSIFNSNKLDLVIIEIGMGGRLDLVNIVNSDCSVITSIDFDHIKFLGNTKNLISIEKSHIFRKNKPVIYGSYYPNKSIMNYSKYLRSDLWILGNDFEYLKKNNDWTYQGKTKLIKCLINPSLKGNVQLKNSSIALASLESLSKYITINKNSINLGLLKVILYFRFQIISTKPTIILDVSHNMESINVLLENIKKMNFFKCTYAIFNICSDKNIINIIKVMSNYIDYWFCPNISNNRGLNPKYLFKIINLINKSKKKNNSICNIYTEPSKAFFEAKKKSKKNDRIIIFGSFILISEILNLIK